MWPTFEQLVNLAVKWLVLNLKTEAYFRNNNGNFLWIACFFFTFLGKLRPKNNSCLLFLTQERVFTLTWLKTITDSMRSGDNFSTGIWYNNVPPSDIFIYSLGMAAWVEIICLLDKVKKMSPFFPVYFFPVRRYIFSPCSCYEGWVR